MSPIETLAEALADASEIWEREGLSENEGVWESIVEREGERLREGGGVRARGEGVEVRHGEGGGEEGAELGDGDSAGGEGVDV